MIDYYKIMYNKLTKEDKSVLLQIKKIHDKEIKGKKYEKNKAIEFTNKIVKLYNLKKVKKYYIKTIKYNSFDLEIKLDNYGIEYSFIFEKKSSEDDMVKNKILIKQSIYYGENEIQHLLSVVLSEKIDSKNLRSPYISCKINPFDVNYNNNELYDYDYGYDASYEFIDDNQKNTYVYKDKDSPFFNKEIIEFFIENYDRINEVKELILLQKDIEIKNDNLINNFIEIFESFTEEHLKKTNKKKKYFIMGIK